MISFFLPPYKQLQRDRAAYDQLNNQLRDEKTTLARLTRQVTLLKNDPTYLETIARDNLEMMKEGETIFRLESRRGKTRGAWRILPLQKADVPWVIASIGVAARIPLRASSIFFEATSRTTADDVRAPICASAAARARSALPFSGPRR